MSSRKPKNTDKKADEDLAAAEQEAPPQAIETAQPVEVRKTRLIKTAINTYLEEGMTDKQELYAKVVKELGVPRPSVRRIARDMRLRNELLDKVNVLRPAAEAQAAVQA